MKAEAWVRPGLGLLITGVLIACATSGVSAGVSYILTDLGGGCAYGINDSGQVVGDNHGGTTPNAWVYASGSRTYLPGSNGAIEHGINNAGEVLSHLDNGSPAVWSQGGYTDIGALLPEYWPPSMAINDRGEIAIGGYGGLWVYYAGMVTKLNGGNLTYPLAFNNNGLIVGTDGNWAQAWPDGYLPGFPGSACGVNDANQIVGGIAPAPWQGWRSQHAFLSSGGAVADLGTLGSDTSSANAINEAGQVVGWSLPDVNSDPHAFIWQDGEMTDLNTLIPPDSGWILLTACDINESGQIVGYGHSPVYSGYDFDAFLLTPTPEPATLSLLALGGLAAILRRRGR